MNNADKYDEFLFSGSYTKRCKKCGELFEVQYPTMYAFKIGNDYFCKWTCFNKVKYPEKNNIIRRIE